MENLKTINELSKPENIGYISTSKLKQEAIKWLKELLNKHAELRLYPYDLQYSITWIKHFFNITDEELQ